MLHFGERDLFGGVMGKLQGRMYDFNTNGIVLIPVLVAIEPSWGHKCNTDNQKVGSRQSKALGLLLRVFPICGFW